MLGSEKKVRLGYFRFERKVRLGQVKFGKKVKFGQGPSINDVSPNFRFLGYPPSPRLLKSTSKRLLLGHFLYPPPSPFGETLFMVGVRLGFEKKQVLKKSQVDLGQEKKLGWVRLGLKQKLGLVGSKKVRLGQVRKKVRLGLVGYERKVFKKLVLVGLEKKVRLGLVRLGLKKNQVGLGQEKKVRLAQVMFGKKVRLAQVMFGKKICLVRFEKKNR